MRKPGLPAGTGKALDEDACTELLELTLVATDDLLDAVLDALLDVVTEELILDALLDVELEELILVALLEETELFATLELAALVQVAPPSTGVSAAPAFLSA